MRTPPANHPKAVIALVLGVLGLAPCLFFLAPVAWWMGDKVVAAIDANPQKWGGRGLAQAGRVTGLVGSALAVVLVLWVGWIVLAVAPERLDAS